MIDDRFLTDDLIDAYRAILAMDGPNVEIEQILLNDRAMRVAWKQVNQSTPRRDPSPASARTPTDSMPVVSRTAATSGPEEYSPVFSHPVAAPPATSTAMPLPDAASLVRANCAVRHRASPELREVLSKLVGALHPHATKRKSHDELRKWIWAINAVMTERDEAAPCVRPQPRMGRVVSPSAMTASEKLMLNDRQMFDLEFAHRHRLGGPKPKWEALLRSEAFNPALAAIFIKTVGGPDKKIDALGLRDDEQMLLAAIRSEKVRKRWERIETDAERLVAHLRAAVAKGASRVAEADIRRWREDYIALVAAEGRPARASVLLRRFFGREKPANQLANRKGDLRDKGFPVD